MNFYGTEKYKQMLNQFDEKIFSKCDMTAPTREKILGDGFVLKCYYYADEQEGYIRYIPYDGEICRLYQNQELVFEWKISVGIHEWQV